MELSRTRRHSRESETHRHRSPSPSRSHSGHHSHGHRSHHHHHHHHGHRSRTRSPEGSRHRHHHHHHHHHHESHHDHDKRKEARRPVILPYNAQELSKHHLESYKPLFASYLDIQKGLDIDEIDEVEVKGRWKSFIGKWNRGELAEGWYDPETLEKAISNAHTFSLAALRSSPVYSDGADERGRKSQSASSPPPRSSSSSSSPARNRQINDDESVDADADEDEDLYGPSLPSNSLTTTTTTSNAYRRGPTNPSLQDIKLKHENELFEREADYESRQRARDAERKLHKSEMKELQEDIAPRAEPGSRERRLEKKREAAASNRAFAESRRGGSPVAEVGDDVLMGSGAASDLAMLKKEKEKMERKKNERELRREEILRARMAEREERLRNYREREDKIIERFRAVAKRRFGTPEE